MFEFEEDYAILKQKVKCAYCKEDILENWGDYILGESQSEGNMGTETLYSIECDEFQCPKCEKWLKVDGYIVAYPDGIYNNHNLKSSLI